MQKTNFSKFVVCAH